MWGRARQRQVTHKATPEASPHRCAGDAGEKRPMCAPPAPEAHGRGAKGDLRAVAMRDRNMPHRAWGGGRRGGPPGPEGTQKRPSPWPPPEPRA
eukprot:3642051-Alexandrium_andersonii.AAC.1